MTKKIYHSLTACALASAFIASADAGEADALADLQMLSNPSSESLWDRFSFGSYGELHYNAGEDVEEVLDLHRLVLFTGFKFSENARFVSEFELEHWYSSRDGQEIEYELEQAFVQFDLANNYTLEVGAFLVPVGFTNEIHEPTTFYGVERNKIDSEIIPTTFTEVGVLLRKRYDSGLQWDFAVHRGLQTESYSGNNPVIRSGRQKANTFDALFTAATGRVKYTGINGLELAASLQYQDDITRDGEDNSAILFTTHFLYNNGGFGLRGQFSQWTIGGDNLNGESIPNQYGAYIEPSYKWSFGDDSAVGVFTRALYYNNASRPDGETEYHVGVNYWPTRHTVLKADYIHSDGKGGRDDQGLWNLGIGYSF
ncbi:MAG: porin [Akkermansiaceae bacterium]